MRVAELAERQHGVVSRKQLGDLGVSTRSIARAVDSGRLRPTLRGVFAVGHMPFGDHTRLMAATLACGGGAVVSHRSAAVLLGLLDRLPAIVEVIAPNQSGRGIDGVRPRFVPPPLGDEVGTCKSVPCTSPSRTLVDLAGILGEASQRRAVERAAVLQILDVSAIERVLDTAKRRGAPTLRRILRDWRASSMESGAIGPTTETVKLRSDLEAHLLALIAAARLPTPLCNQVIAVDRKRIEVDFLWPANRLVVETDGRSFHDNPFAFERDRLRDRVLNVSGYRVIHFTYDQVRDEADAVIAAIRHLLALGKEGAAGPVTDLVPPPLR